MSLALLLYTEESDKAISPKLFAAVVESLLTKLTWEEGIRIDGEQLTHLLFADDCVILAKDTAELENKLQQLQTLSHDIGLEVNTLKTKWMWNEHCAAGIITVNRKVIKEVNKYIYLGQQLSRDNSFEGECSRRRKAGWVSFNKIKTSLTDDELPMKKRKELFNSTVLPAMIYECHPESNGKANMQYISP
ncbi:unnamed protein product [Natator depressus]